MSGKDEVVRVIQGSKMKLSLSDAGISRELFLTGVHEPHSTRQFVQDMRPGMTVLEVGANIGYYALIAAQHIRPNGGIIALEPSPSNVQMLRDNFKMNDIEDMIDIYPIAAGSQAGSLPFYVVSKSNLSGFIKREGHGIELLSKLDVKVMPVDEIVAEDELTIDYFRMDVEGFEDEVISGMVKLLTGANPPKGGFIEVHSELLNKKGSSGRSFLEQMDRLGYSVKVARFRGRDDIVVNSNSDLYAHPLLEDGYWETFFNHRAVT